MQVGGCNPWWTLAALLLLPSTSVLASQAHANDPRFQFALDRGSIAWVLEQFSRQTGLQIGTQISVAESQTDELGPLIAHTTADEAMKALLRGTDLDFIWQDDSTIRLYATVVRPPHADDNVQEVVVTGTRLRRNEDEPTPASVSVYGRAEIARLGFSSVSDLSRYLTQQPFNFSDGYLQSGAQFLQMRGLGFDTTLVLLNGRRMPPSANSISLNAVDLNNIPLAAVDHIDVMSTSASSIYGADAIGGVVNIVMKDKSEEPEIHLHYGQADGGSMQRRATVSFGTADPNLNSVLVLDYYQTTALMGEERPLWRDQDYRRFGGLDYRVSTTYPGNVYSLSTQPLPGLSSSRAAVPAGTTAQLTPADFLATDGTTNLASSFSRWSITPASERISAYGSASYLLTEDLTVFGEFLAENNAVTALRGPPSITRQVVPATNPYNPFPVPVAVDYSFADLDSISHLNRTHLLRFVGGARGRLHQWEWEVTGLSHAEDGTTTTRGEIDRTALAGFINSTDPATALNLFADGAPGSLQTMAALTSPPRTLDFSFSNSQLSAFVRGPLFELGGGKAELVLGGEWRQDVADFFESGVRVDASRDITSMFSELRVPLSDALSLKFAVRRDDYDHGDHIVNPQYGLTWRVTKDWQFHTTYSTSFRPPSLFELNMPALQPSVLIADPLRGGQVSNVNVIVGGNPELEFVTARSFTAGVVFKPSEMPDLSIGATHWRVVMNNRIMSPPYQALLHPDSPLADHVVRDAPSSQDRALGWPGRLRAIDVMRMNYGDLKTSGIDLNASLLLGAPRSLKSRWKLDLAVTWIDEYLSRDMNQVLPLDRVGIANPLGTIPKWRAIGCVSWKLGNIGASSTATFVPSYQDATWWAGPVDRRIGSQTLVDMQTWLELHTEGLLEDSMLTLGARNVFNEAPEFANAGASQGYDISQNNLIGRLIYFRVSKRF